MTSGFSQVFIKEYRDYLQKNFNRERAVNEKRYLYSDLKHYGVSVWQMDAYFKFHKKELEDLSKKEVVGLVKILWAAPSHEEKSMALRVLQLHKDKLNISDIPFIEILMRESRGWALLDELIIPLMPEILSKDKKAYSVLNKWIVDDDFWVRRSALLAQNLFFRIGEGGDPKFFFTLARSQFDEEWIDKIYTNQLQRKRARFFIRKAIGWALREMSGKKPDIVFKFLKENKNKMSGLSFKEGSRKLPKNYGF